MREDSLLTGNKGYYVHAGRAAREAREQGCGVVVEYNHPMAPSTKVIEYGAFSQPPSSLFCDYVSGSPRAAPFFLDGGRWGLAQIRSTAERNATRVLPREALSSALAAQQHARGAGRAAEIAARLAHPNATAVVTGQQATLFGGPLYVLYKALAAVEVAARLEADRGAPVVPVFWVAADDHDFAEIRTVPLLADSGTIRTLRYTPRQEPLGAPASAILMDDTIVALIDELASILPLGNGRDSTIARVADAYQSGRSMADAFARLLSSLVPDLVVLDIGDTSLKRLGAGVLARELRERSPSSRSVLEVGRNLLAAGYHQQAPVREGLLNLFVVVDDVRRPLGLVEDGIEIRGTGRRMGMGEALGWLEAEPGLWSPGALLRPLFQDSILPTGAYIGGPAEVAYHAQIGACYEHFEVARPVLMPRPGVTLLDAQSARVLDAESLELRDFQGDSEGLISRWVRQAYPDIEEGFERIRITVGKEMTDLAKGLGAHDPTLEGAAQAATGRMLHPLETLLEKSLRALKKRDQARADRLRRTHDTLFPGGSFQERGLSTIGMLARHGDDLPARLRAIVDPWARGHQLVTV
jgi:bacillithiol biosynthesis cysteine-adding enzyme BshC